MFSENVDRNIMDSMNGEEELLTTFEKDTVEDAHIAASEGMPLVNMKVTPNLSELEAFIDKEYDDYLVWSNNNSLLSKHLQLANVLLFVALLITLKLVLVVLNHP